MKGIWKSIGFVITALALVSCHAVETAEPGIALEPNLEQADNEELHVEAEIVSEEETFLRDEMITQAEAIFLGRVDFVGETKWNQESGAYWAEGQPYYHIAVSVVQPLVDEIGLGTGGVLTVSGKSPLNGQSTGGDAMTLVDSSRQELQVGDEIILFVRQSEMTWRDGRIQTVMTPFSDLASSTMDADLFHSLAAEMLHKRPILSLE
jgi:hypothetical protein